MTSEQPPPPPQPPAPGWWLASDGNWYPPQSASPPPQQPQQLPPQQYTPPVKSSSGKGCLIALAVVAALGVLGVIGIAVAVFVIADKVEEVAVGDISCPSEGDVSDLIGSEVNLSMSGSVIVAAGCNYTSTESASGAGVTITSGAGLIAEEILTELENSARANNTEAVSIELGEDGLAYGSPTRSAAATKDDGRIVEVDIFSSDGAPIGDKRDEAIELLERFLDLNN